MSDGRKRLSGSGYRKEAQKKLEKQREVVEKTAKISNFFKKSNSQDENLKCTPTDNVTPCGSGRPNYGQTHVKEGDDALNDAEASIKEPERPSSSRSSNEDKVIPYPLDVKIVDDPALWEINDRTREYVVTRGINQNIDEMDLSRSKRLIGGQNRYLSKSLLKTKLINGKEMKRSYLMYSESSGKLYCVPCQLFGGTTKLAKEGCDDWKHGNDILKSHENSSDHKTCVLAIKTRMSSKGIQSLLTSQIEDEQNYWRNVLKRVVAVVKSLAAAGLPLRGHDETFGSLSNSGNFILCLELIAEFDPFIAEHIAKYGNPGQGHTSYLSSTTYEEFVKLMAHKVVKEIVEEVKVAKYFSIIVDSSPDITHTDQLAIVLRYVLPNGKSVERFLCFLPSVGHRSEALFDAVIKDLAENEIDIENCRGQSFDNASNMSGMYTGLQARIREVSPSAMYTPCSAHSLNLVGDNAASCCTESTNFFLLLQNLYVFFTSSTKRWEILKELLVKKENVSLKKLSGTRWSARDDACQSLNRDWNEVIEALTVISNDENEKPKTRCEASGYLQQIQRLETAILSILWGDLLSRFNLTSKKLQSTYVDLSTVAKLYESLIEYVNSIRDEFEIYENGALEKAGIAEYEDQTRRKKKRKLLAGETRDNETELSGGIAFKTNTYLVIVDRLISELTRRKEVYSLLSARFDFLISGATMNSNDIKDNAARLSKEYPNDLPDAEEFGNECLHFFGFIKTIDKEDRPKTLPTFCELLYDNDLQDLYPYVDIALRIFSTMPASNCSAERSFSVLRRIKNYLRSTMSHDRLNWSAVLSIESDMTKKINYDDIIDLFAANQSRRKKF